MGIYGLKQAAILVYENLKRSLLPFRYAPVICTAGFWKHYTRPTIFCLCVDNFNIKNHTNNDAQHLLDKNGKSYQYTTDWTGNNYCELTLEWNY